MCYACGIAHWADGGLVIEGDVDVGDEPHVRRSVTFQ
jgi:hypothetical protein